jgi:hypothetical protein
LDFCSTQDLPLELRKRKTGAIAEADMHRIFSVLLVISALLAPSYSFCPSTLGEGTEFSITDWSCVNYTADFSWDLDLLVADTTVQLSCTNDTNEQYSPDIPLTFRTSLTHSFPLPLTGEVECQISGCYENRDTFTQYLIPVFSFPCPPPPPPPPNSMSPSSMVAPSPSPTSKLYKSQERSTLQPSTSPSIREGGPQELEVVVIVVPLTTLFGGAVIFCLVVFCVYVSHKQLCGDNGKAFVLHPQDEYDQNYSPFKLTDINNHMFRSTETILEQPVRGTTVPDNEHDTTPSPTAEDDVDNVSTASSQHQFSSLGSEKLAVAAASTHPGTVEDSVPAASIGPNTTENDEEITSEEMENIAGLESRGGNNNGDGTINSSRNIPTSAYVSECVHTTGLQSTVNTNTVSEVNTSHIMGTSTYVLESDVLSSSGAPSPACGTMDCRISSTHQSSLPQHVETEKGSYVTELFNGANGELSTTPLMSDTVSRPPLFELDGDFVTVEMEPETNQRPTAPQSAAGNEFLGQCAEEDEVAMGFTEIFTHTTKPQPSHSLPSPDSTGTTSGLSTGSYLEWSTTEH